jgi:cation diffusion facilitator family transporter
LVSVVLAAKPPDLDHPYGHGKIEYFSAGFEGALIIVAAIGIFIEGFRQALYPRPLPSLEIGALIVLGATAVNLGLGLILVRTGKKTGSLVLVADGRHVMTDVYTSGAVLVGAMVVYFTGMYRLDGGVACFAGLNIVVSGAQLVRQAFSRLMDASDPRLLEDICSALVTHRKEVWIDVHRLRAWRSGNRIHVDFHLILPRDLPLEEGHREVKYLEEVFNSRFRGQADLLVHLDPCVEPDCPVCNLAGCENRIRDKLREALWRTDTLVEDAKPLTACLEEPSVLHSGVAWTQADIAKNRRNPNG